MDVDIDVTRSKAEGLPAIQQDRSFGKRFELLPTAVDFRFTSAAAPSNSGRNFRFRCLNSSSSSALQTTKNQPKIHQTLTIKKPKRPKPTKTNQNQPNPNKNQPKIHHEGTKTNQKSTTKEPKWPKPTTREPKIHQYGTKTKQNQPKTNQNWMVWVYPRRVSATYLLRLWLTHLPFGDAQGALWRCVVAVPTPVRVVARRWRRPRRVGRHLREALAQPRPLARTPRFKVRLNLAGDRQLRRRHQRRDWRVLAVTFIIYIQRSRFWKVTFSLFGYR